MFFLKSSAASLFNGSDGFGSRNKYSYKKNDQKGRYLKAVYHSVQVQDGLPVLAKDV